MGIKKGTSGRDAIRYEDGIIAPKKVCELAAERGARVAICGGLALHLYGFTRATKDVNLIGDQKLNLKPIKKLNFGGYAYEIPVDGAVIEVDVIIRDDDVKELYDLALDNAKVNKELGIKVITPEYLVILKYLAGRGKDQIDVMWLLREEHLVNRTKVKGIVKKQMGKHSYWALRDLDQLFLEADLLKARDQRGE